MIAHVWIVDDLGYNWFGSYFAGYWTQNGLCSGPSAVFASSGSVVWLLEIPLG